MSASLPGLPPLPSLKAGATMGAIPPPPKYPQPPQRSLPPGPGGGAQGALMPPPPPPGTIGGMPQLPGPRAAGAGDREQVPPPPGTMISDGTHQALPPDLSAGPCEAGDAEEAAGSGRRRLQLEAKHGMIPSAPPLNPLSGPPPTPPGGMTPGGTPGRSPSGTPSGSVTPSVSQFGTPKFPPNYNPPSEAGSSFVPPPPNHLPMMPAAPAGVSRGIVHRGEPANFIPVPFNAPGLPPGPPGMTMPGGGPPGFPAMSAASGIPAPPPPPPPPPREDDPTFVRRVRLAYIDRAAKSHQQILQDEGQDVAWVAPEWVFNVTLLSPYIASTVSIACNVIMNLAFSTKFARVEEQHWYYGVITGFLVSVLILEVIRAAVTTIVELRKFEIRRRLVGGDFLKSRIRKNDEIGLKGRKPPPRKPAVPLQPPRNPPKATPPPPPPAKPPMARPSFLPAETGNSNPTGMPSLRAANGQSLPVGAPPPGMPSMGPGGPPGVPPINMRSGRSPRGVGGGFTPLGTPGGAGLMPGKLDGTPTGTPKTPIGTPGGGSLLPGAMDGARRAGGAPPPPPMMPGGMPPRSPGGSAVTGVTQDLTEKLKGNRVTNPPPPPTPGGRVPGGPPSRPNSRPTSHRSGDGSKTPPKPSTPPPSGTLQQTRARARQDA